MLLKEFTQIGWYLEVFDWINEAKNQKELFIKINAFEKDMPPCVGLVRDDKVLCMVVSSKCERDEGLKIAQILRESCGTFDWLTLYMDTCSSNRDSVDEAPQKGELQRLKEMVPNTPQIWESIMCLRINRDKKLEYATLKYKITNEDIVWEEADEFEGATIEGFIPSVLKKIIDKPIMSDRPEFKELIGAEFNDLGPEERERHEIKGALTVLGYMGHFLYVHNDLIEEEGFADPNIQIHKMGDN